jgi:predicted ATPase
VYEIVYEKLKQQTELTFPDFKELYMPLAGEGTVSFQWSSKDFPLKPIGASQLSDGILRFLGLAAILLQANLPEPPALIAIDEPEIGLHPKLLPYLGGLLKQASERTQIIVSTHSPQLLNSEAIELQDIVLVERHNGETVMKRADSQQGLARWLDRYTLGQLWTMGRLEIAE